MTSSTYIEDADPSRRLHPLHARHHSAVSRHLLLGWLFWLLISVTVNLSIDSPLSTWTSSTLRPAVRGLAQSIIIGLVVVWPAWRLSQRRSAYPGLQTATDVFLLLLTTQIPLLGMMAWAGWPLRHMLLIDLIIVVYTVAAGVAVWIGWRAAGGLVRMSAAAVCVALLLGGWLGVAVGGAAGAALWSPNYMLWRLTHPLSELPVEQVLWRLSVLGAATLAVWLGALGYGDRPHKGDAPRL